MAQCARQTLRDYQMIQPGTTVIAGLSGGADSVALLHWLYTASQKAISINLMAAHINHMLRGEESDQDEAFCAAFCKILGIPLHVKRIDVAALAKKSGVGVEEAGRNARHAFFAELARENTRIALAHTLSDRIETMLLNMKRGAALRGFCSIPPIRSFGEHLIIRPLIECSRAQVENYCAYHKLEYRVDQSNFDPTYRRNQIRLEVLPALGLNDDAMRRTFRALERDEAYLAQEATQAAGIRNQESGLPEALRNRVLRDQLAASGIEPSQIRIQEAGRRAQKIEVRPRKATVNFEIIDYTAEKFTNKDLANCLDYDTIAGDLVVSARRPGDCMHLCNGAGTKPLKKLFQERKVPPGEREQRVVLRDGEGIVWLEGFGCAHRCRVTDNTRKLLVVELRVEN